MPSDARWRRSKIVDLSEQNQWQEIIGGLKNALERGESLEKAKKSFINAGYKKEKVETASQRISQPQITQVNPQPKQTQPQPQPPQPVAQPKPQPQPQPIPATPPVQLSQPNLSKPQQPQPQPPQPQPAIQRQPPQPIARPSPQPIPTTQPPKKKFPLFITILIIIAIIDLFGAAFFILFWDKIF